MSLKYTLILSECSGEEIQSFLVILGITLFGVESTPKLHWSLLQSSGLIHSFESRFHYFESGSLTILSVDFHSKTKWFLIWLLKEWISTPAHLESMQLLMYQSKGITLYPGGLTLNSSKMAFIAFWDETLQDGLMDASSRSNTVSMSRSLSSSVTGQVSGTSSGDMSGLQGPVSWSSLSITSGTRLKTKSAGSQSKARISIAYNIINYCELLLIAGFVKPGP